MAYYKKRQLIEALQPDVLILQEVAKKDISSAAHPFAAWTGSNPNKGLGVLGIANARYKVTEFADPNLPGICRFRWTDLTSSPYGHIS